MLRLTLLPLLLCALTAHAQLWLADDFSDGDFSAQPAWTGHTDRFIVNAEGQLQLADADPASSNIRWLVTPLPGLPHPDDTLTWTCFVRLDFAPSSANHARIWLIADDADLSLAQNGWYIQVGGISGSGDALLLVRVEDGQATTLLSGTAGAVGADPAVARLRVRRLPQGTWTLEADYTGGTDYAFEGQAADPFLPQGWYFGLWCRYTATRAQAFFFDDVVCGPFRADDEPPRLLGVTVLAADHLVLSCSEPVAAVSAADPASFAIEPADVLVAESWRDANDPTRVHLLLAPPLQSGQTYRLAAPALTDLAGNAAADTLELLWYATAAPQRHDVLITEIMADPTPAHGLPEAEYVELFNRSARVFDLAGWSFASNNSTATLPHHYLLPGQYVVLTDAAHAADFAPFGKTLGVDGFPAIANSGSTLTLRDDAGTVVHQLTWSPAWHRDGKDEGGWSLEMRNAEALCAGADNWSSTLAFIGGTPGRPNSLPPTLPDTLPPRLRWIEVAAARPDELWLVFDEAVDEAAAADTSLFQLRLSANDARWPVWQASVAAERPEAVHLVLGAPLPDGQTLTLTVEAGFADCMGNALAQPLEVALRRPEASPAAARINELMYEPDEDGAEYVELALPADAPLDPALLALALLHDNGDTTVVPLTAHRLWWPGSWLVLSAEPERLRRHHGLPDTALLIKAPLPALPNEGATLLLLARSDSDYELVESIAWSPDWHSPLLSQTRGVSLERIRPDWPPTPDNWHSAAATAGYATPARPNSQYRPLPAETQARPCRLLSPVVSPDGDGFEDVLLVECTLEAPAAARLRIYDAAGRLVWHAPELQWLGTRNVLQWDGRTDFGRLAPRGLYALYVELIRADGTVLRQRLGAAVW